MSTSDSRLHGKRLHFATCRRHLRARCNSAACRPPPDPLTGLLNRRTLENRVYELLQRGEAFAIAMGDLDHFKPLNDTHGHEAGDRALRLFARTGTLEELLRVADAILGKQARLQNPDKEDVLPRKVIGLAVPGRPIRSLVAEGRSAGGVRDQTDRQA